MKSKLSAAGICAAATILAWAASASAVDGTIEINQAKVLAAGGFPYVISTANTSYRLTGSLTVSATNTSGISVTAPNVTIDLNGFSIAGGGGLSASAAAIDGSSAVGLTVENGTTTGFSGAGVVAGNNSIVRNMHAISNATGISCGNGCVISGNTANSNGNGIFCNLECLISGNTVINSMIGIQAADATTGYGGNVLKNGMMNVSNGTSLGHNLCNGVVC